MCVWFLGILCLFPAKGGSARANPQCPTPRALLQASTGSADLGGYPFVKRLTSVCLSGPWRSPLLFQLSPLPLLTLAGLSGMLASKQILKSDHCALKSQIHHLALYSMTLKKSLCPFLRLWILKKSNDCYDN